MPAEATNAADLPGPIPATPAAPGLAHRAEQIVGAVDHAVFEVWSVFRLTLFAIYLLIAVLSFWLWALTAVVGLVRFALRALMFLLLWLSGGAAPRPGPPAPNMAAALRLELQYMWDRRLLVYDELARPLARHLTAGRRITRTFWHWHAFRKAIALVAVGAFIVVPGFYVVPRPHEVQITDDNAVDYDKAGSKTTYLVHALDMRVDGKHREYLNEDAWYFGKINSQGLKSQLQIGRTYRLWVVGLRWYFMPTLYPNIISATEIDAKGNVVARPAMLAVPAAAAPAAPASR